MEPRYCEACMMNRNGDENDEISIVLASACVRVPQTLHPDGRLFVCEDHFELIAKTQVMIAYLDAIDNTARIYDLS